MRPTRLALLEENARQWIVCLVPARDHRSLLGLDLLFLPLGDNRDRPRTASLDRDLAESLFLRHGRHLHDQLVAELLAAGELAEPVLERSPPMLPGERSDG